MSRSFRFLSLPNLYHLTEGLTFNIPRCADVFDGALAAYNEKTRNIDRIYAWNKRNPATRGPLCLSEKGRLIINVTQRFSQEKGMVYLTEILQQAGETESAPVVFFSMLSPTLDIPMRLEVPLRALVKGAPLLRGTYTVYLHCLLSDDGRDYVYYGITKRGWNGRLGEHMTSAFRDGSRRLFPLKMRELIEARADQLNENTKAVPRLKGMVTTVCAIGLSEDAAMDSEEYLVDKYSLSSKHANGLNMIPGGREGIRSLHRLALGERMPLIETEDREALLDGYLKSHPQLGKPNPGVAEKWHDPAYAEAVICARENRLSANQVREIRYLAALGNSLDQIRSHIGALDNGQVSRVLEGRTYSRIQ
jgi:hypothetical protein